MISFNMQLEKHILKQIDYVYKCLVNYYAAGNKETL